MVIKNVSVKDFMLFDSIDIDFSPNINVISGENSTGKTALIKLLYAISKEISNFAAISDGYKPKVKSLAGIHKNDIGGNIPKKLTAVFGIKDLPDLSSLVRLRSSGEMQVTVDYGMTDKIKFTVSSEPFSFNMVSRSIPPEKEDIVYIPPKEMISATENFASLYEEYHISFDETYYDLCRLLNRPQKKRLEEGMQAVSDNLENLIKGKVVQKNNLFFLDINDVGEVPMGLIAEGYRKISTLLHLISTGTLTKGSILFWDEPETNMNPRMIKPLAEALLEIANAGVQIFTTTHDYFLQQYLNLAAVHPKKNPGDLDIRFISLYREDGTIRHESESRVSYLEHNTIMEEYDNIFDEEQSLVYGDE